MYQGKRFLDLTLSVVFLLFFSPVLTLAILSVYLTDFRNPFYVSRRVGVNDKDFKMIKIRSMRVHHSHPFFVSTAKGDLGITPVGKIIRKLKIDELSQFVNVLSGTMSIVGPRAQTRKWGTDLYTSEEYRLLSVKPGITDFASIVFSDEDAILSGSVNPDLEYNQLIRPWKSRLSLHCIDKSSFWFDIFVIFLTSLSILDRRLPRRLISFSLSRSGFCQLSEVASRRSRLQPFPPPGSSCVEDGSFYSL